MCVLQSTPPFFSKYKATILYIPNGQTLRDVLGFIVCMYIRRVNSSLVTINCQRDIGL